MQPTIRDLIMLIENSLTIDPGSLTEAAEEHYYLYHGTSWSALASIRLDGLVPRPPDQDGWPEFQGLGKRRLPKEAFEPRVFLTPVFDMAAEYAKSFGGGPLMLRINADDLECYDGEADQRYNYTNKTISPKLIDVLVGPNWIPISQVKSVPSQPLSDPSARKETFNLVGLYDGLAAFNTSMDRTKIVITTDAREPAGANVAATVQILNYKASKLKVADLSQHASVLALLHHMGVSPPQSRAPRG